ncbi:hypothetical protein [Bacillus pseudomycoides]|uniref:hypothetical protein n=1 Tax=Bacillus pseudomycoides TaxID=64104 RepID=UPI0020D24D8B|nr:hypothetical protein [Bacillus pseudomycoides]
MEPNANNFMQPFSEGEGPRFGGRVVQCTPNDNGLSIIIPVDMLEYAGIKDTTSVEVWQELDGKISFRIATKCDVCRRGARTFPLTIGSNVRYLCAEDYYKLAGEYPQKPQTEPIEQQ